MGDNTEMSYYYLGSPYTHEDEAVRNERYDLACLATVKLLKMGIHIFSPIGHSHPLARDYGLAGDWKFWEDYDKTMMRPAEGLIILTIDGWRESTGLSHETLFMSSKKKSITLVSFDNSHNICHSGGDSIYIAGGGSLSSDTAGKIGYSDIYKGEISEPKD